MRINYFLIIILVSFYSISLCGREIPRLSGPVIDEVGLLSKAANRQLSLSLKSFEQSAKVQLQLLIIDSLGDESLEGYSIKVVDRWQLGRKGEDRGILFLIAFKDRKMRIEVGRGLEGQLTDVLAGRVVDMTRPYFKAERYQDGIIVATNAIATIIGGELKDIPVVSRNAKKSSGGFPLIIIIFILIFIFGRRRGGGGMLPLLIAGSMLSGGRSSASSGSWSGGGGGFSGGGASGGW